MKIIDGSNLLLGRLCTYVAKKALEGEVRQLDIRFKMMIPKLDKGIKLANQLENVDLISTLEELKIHCKDALDTALQLTNIDKKIKELLIKF